MSNDRTAALALIAGSSAGLVTMALHPTGADVVANATTGSPNTLSQAVHALAVVAQPLVLAGALALTLRLRARRDLSVGAYVFFAMASVAVIVAAVASGFLAPGVLRGLDAADAPARVTMLSALRFVGLVNQTFAILHVAFSGIAILLWSSAMLAGREMSRALAVYGLVLGALLLVGIVSGTLQLDIHGFGLVVLGEGAWMVWAASQLWRAGA